MAHKWIGGLLAAATMLTPIVPAYAASDTGIGAQISNRIVLAQRDDRQDRRSDRRAERRNTHSRSDDTRSERRSERRADRRVDRRIEQRQERRAEQRHDRRVEQRRDHRRDHRIEQRRDQRSWNRDWRSDRRYDYRNYRNSHRSTYRLGRYYAPYRDYRYRRLNIGFSIGSLFYGNRYTINDPWQYRLPPARYPYRWVRYYNDALLVDTRRGRVVDVIYGVFW